MVVANAEQSAPAGLGWTDETAAGLNDGTLTGVTSAMEYRNENDAVYTPVTGTSVTDLAPGVYYVRYAARPNYNAGADAMITINAYHNVKFSINMLSFQIIKTTLLPMYYCTINSSHREERNLPGRQSAALAIL